jgi:hypothetical protein
LLAASGRRLNTICIWVRTLTLVRAATQTLAGSSIWTLTLVRSDIWLCPITVSPCLEADSQLLVPIHTYSQEKKQPNQSIKCSRKPVENQVGKPIENAIKPRGHKSLNSFINSLILFASGLACSATPRENAGSLSSFASSTARNGQPLLQGQKPISTPFVPGCTPFDTIYQ